MVEEVLTGPPAEPTGSAGREFALRAFEFGVLCQ